MEGIMDKETIIERLIDEIVRNQKLNGIHDCRLEYNTKPIGDLAMFDSLTSAEVLTEMEQILEDEYGIKCELDVSLFYTDKGRQAMTKKISHRSQTIEEIADNIYHQIS